MCVWWTQHKGCRWTVPLLFASPSLVAGDAMVESVELMDHVEERKAALIAPAAAGYWKDSSSSPLNTVHYDQLRCLIHRRSIMCVSRSNLLAIVFNTKVTHACSVQSRRRMRRTTNYLLYASSAWSGARVLQTLPIKDVKCTRTIAVSFTKV